MNGAHPGPRVWLDAALHGDELNGMEIIREVLEELDPKTLRGSVLAVPVVNVFGLVYQIRYLPDRRDLNRSFPGSTRGSLAARIAHLFLEEVVSRCDIGIDLHTGSLHRTNLPQIRADLADAETRRLATAFAAPVMIHAPSIKGSLRDTARKLGKTVLLYEAGEPLRFNSDFIRRGVNGIFRVLEALDMRRGAPPPRAPTREITKTRWLRAGRSGVFHLRVGLGSEVKAKQILGTISDPVSDPFSQEQHRVRAPEDATVIGFTSNPLVHQGDALIHLGMLAEAEPVEPAAAKPLKRFRQG